MVTYEQLWAADPSAWRTAGTAWQGVTGLVDRRTVDIGQTSAAIRQAWSSPAGRAAGAGLDGLRV